MMMSTPLPDHLRTGLAKAKAHAKDDTPDPDLDARLAKLLPLKRAIASHRHAVYRAYFDAGFSEAQAFALLQAEIAAQRR